MVAIRRAALDAEMAALRVTMAEARTEASSSAASAAASGGEFGGERRQHARRRVQLTPRPAPILITARPAIRTASSGARRCQKLAYKHTNGGGTRTTRHAGCGPLQRRYETANYGTITSVYTKGPPRDDATTEYDGERVEAEARLYVPVSLAGRRRARGCGSTNG